MFERTMKFKPKSEEICSAKEILAQVYGALQEKGYNPINQLVGYLLSGDPAYVTSHNDARILIRRLERDELLEELLRCYLNRLDEQE
jgi:uncharacterized protein (UPF0297 family)